MTINLAPVPEARFRITHLTTGAGREAQHRETFLEITLPGGQLVQRGDAPLLTVEVGEPSESGVAEIALQPDEVQDLVWWLMGQCAAPLSITENLAERMRDGEAAIRVLEAHEAFAQLRSREPVGDVAEHEKAMEFGRQRIISAQNYWELRRLRHGPPAEATTAEAEAAPSPEAGA